jgi:hypothetical protein
MPSASTKKAPAVQVRSNPKTKPAAVSIAEPSPSPVAAAPPNESAKKPVRVAGEKASAGPKANAATGNPRGPATRVAKNSVPAARTPAVRPKGGLSALDAAAQVLGALPAKAAAEGLSAGDLIDRMAAQRLWTSPGGKTPAATLYAAMVREITKRKGESRFRKLGPGRFVPGSASPRGGKTRNASASVIAKSTAKAPQKSAEGPRKLRRLHPQVRARRGSTWPSTPSTPSARRARDYIKSQRSHGWLALPASYDDGGLLRRHHRAARPATAAGRHRAGASTSWWSTRSIGSAARSTTSRGSCRPSTSTSVSFVSVTQQFNTTTSMGRLTLNMLLSFAQFEREVAGERIRDKIAATKRKGRLWYRLRGQRPPLGYRSGPGCTSRSSICRPGIAFRP